jgi:hypothetical protein
MRKLEGKRYSERTAATLVSRAFPCPACGGRLGIFEVRAKGKDLFLAGHSEKNCPVDFARAIDVITWRLDCLIDLLEEGDEK